MAFLQLDEFGDDMLNIGNPVGLRKPNTPTDVLLVQALLAIVFKDATELKNHRPGNRAVVVSSRLEKDTPALIATFQSVDLHRPKPQGFVNQAPNGKSPQTRLSTLFRLWLRASTIQVATSGEDLLPRLQREHPSLQNLPRRASEFGLGN